MTTTVTQTTATTTRISHRNAAASDCRGLPSRLSSWRS